MLSLKNDGWDIAIAPEYGASILSCQFQESDILRRASEDWLDHKAPFESGCFPLVPFSNRIANGQFEFMGQSVNLPRNHPQHLHPIHGNGWTSSWDIRSQRNGHCELYLRHEGGDWPWPFDVIYRIEISGCQLMQTLEIKNTGHSPMPAGLGFHPYFPNRETAALGFKAKGYWSADDEQLPTHWTRCSGDSDFSHKKPVDKLFFDNCFNGWDGVAAIEWPDGPHNLTINGSNDFDHAVLYTPLDQTFFCFEPVTHENNALANSGPEHSLNHMTLAAGASKQASMNITVIS